jgi:hypothetical protein
MKRGTPRHPKLLALMEALHVDRAKAVGTLELLWHWTSDYAPAGDIGRWSDATIADACGWSGDPGELIAGLVRTGWVDMRTDTRLVVHHWNEHCDDGVHLFLARRQLQFATGDRPSDKRLSRKERAAIKRRAHEKRIESAPTGAPAPAPAPAPATNKQQQPPPPPASAGGAIPPDRHPPSTAYPEGRIPADRVRQAVEEVAAYAATLGHPALRPARRQIGEWFKAGLTWDQVCERVEKGDHVPRPPL